MYVICVYVILVHVILMYVIVVTRRTCNDDGIFVQCHDDSATVSCCTRLAAPGLASKSCARQASRRVCIDVVRVS